MTPTGGGPGKRPALGALKKAEKHDIDVVVDRLRTRTEVRQCLAESFEAALRMAGGRAIALELDSGREHLFSSRFACPACAYSLPELEPRLFSFNAPMGACPHCDGLGQQIVFDPDRVVAFPSLSLASGAVKGWDRRNATCFAMLECIARHLGVDLEMPFEQLPARARETLLHGSGDEAIEFTYTTEGTRGRPAAQGRYLIGSSPAHAGPLSTVTSMTGFRPRRVSASDLLR